MPLTPSNTPGRRAAIFFPRMRHFSRAKAAVRRPLVSFRLNRQKTVNHVPERVPTMSPVYTRTGCSGQSESRTIFAE